MAAPAPRTPSHMAKWRFPASYVYWRTMTVYTPNISTFWMVHDGSHHFSPPFFLPPVIWMKRPSNIKIWYFGKRKRKHNKTIEHFISQKHQELRSLTDLISFCFLSFTFLLVLVLLLVVRTAWRRRSFDVLAEIPGFLSSLVSGQLFTGKNTDLFDGENHGENQGKPYVSCRCS